MEIIQLDSYTPHITHADGTQAEAKWEASNFYARGEAEKPSKATIVGGKTGTTQKAGNCLILLSKDGQEQPYISVIMGAESKDLLYEDMTTLIDEGIASAEQEE